MTDRLTVDQINSDQLDQLYDDLDRVRELADRWVKAGPPPLGTPTARWWDRRLAELHAAIRPTADTRWQPDETLDYGTLPPPAADPNAPLRTGNALPKEQH